MYIPYGELEKLVAFYQYQSLTKVSEHLLISQPALSKGLHKLENELQVQLFEQYPNKIVLTDTGILAAKKAQILLEENLKFQHTIKSYEDKNHSILTSVVTPGLKEVIEKHSYSRSMKVVDIADYSAHKIIEFLLKGKRNLVISSHNIQQQNIKSSYIGTEKLFINFPNANDLDTSNLAKLTHKALPGIIVLDNMGIWETIFHEFAPKITLIKQDDHTTLNQIHELSNIPFISSNIYSAIDNTDFIKMPVKDYHFQLKLFANYRSNDNTNFRSLIHTLKDELSNV